jgi:hypothetical protein
MKRIDETDHIRVLLQTGAMMTHDQKMGLVAQIRDNAIAAIVKVRPETIMEGHDLTAPYQAYHFIGALRQEAITLELTATLNLLEACTRTLDHGQINANAICSAYAKTDGNLISGTKSADGGELGRKNRDQNNEDEKELWRNTAKSILAGRKKKPGQRELARLVGSQLNQLDKADSRRKWIADLL